LKRKNKYETKKCKAPDKSEKANSGTKKKPQSRAAEKALPTINEEVNLVRPL
jgi:hypothetical protein